MRTLIVGIGALGGVIAGRMLARGQDVTLATRDAESAASLRAHGITITGIGGDARVAVTDVQPVTTLSGNFDLIVLATKAHAAIELAPRLIPLLAPGGALVPIQNGGVSQLLAGPSVVGGLSNLGATMIELGEYAQRNAGHILIADDPRSSAIRETLAVEVRVSPNFAGAVWSKLLLNCSTTTLGAIAGMTMRQYIELPEGEALFDRTYDEALEVALATGVRPEKMLVEPIPPADRVAWRAQVLASYGDLKASMLQDFERKRPTEIDFINGYVVDIGKRHGVRANTNEVITHTVKAITRGELTPNPALLGSILGAWSSIGTRSASS